MIPTRHVNSGRLPSLDPVLWKWINLNLQFAKRTEWRDCPWWYNERSSVGLLSAATWACGGLALEDYITRKANTGIHRRGRCDLRIELGRMHFACEAKQLWFHFERRSFSPSQAIVGALNQACSDALNLNPSEGRRLGLCFIIPRVPISQSNQINDYLASLFDTINSIEWHALAWCFPEATRNLRAENNRCYPGAALLIKHASRRP